MGRYFIPIQTTTPEVTFLFESHLPHPQPAHCSTRMAMYGDMIAFEKYDIIKGIPRPPFIKFRLRIPYTSEETKVRDWTQALGTLIFNMAEYAGERGAKIAQIIIEGIHEQNPDDV